MGLVHCSGAKQALQMHRRPFSSGTYELSFATPLNPGRITMSNNSESNIATADALTLLLHNQHAIGAAIDEVTKWLSENGAEEFAVNASMAMETLDQNARALSEAIMRLRQI
jgi:hypothetical protein